MVLNKSLYKLFELHCPHIHTDEIEKNISASLWPVISEYLSDHSDRSEALEVDLLHQCGWKYVDK